MLKDRRTYIDYNGNERTEDFWFNITKAEALEMELSKNGGLSAVIDRLVQINDFATISQILKDLILKAYGVKSPDGRRFIKSQELRDEFEQTEAFSDIYMELSTDAKKAAAFINGIVPNVNINEAAVQPVPEETASIGLSSAT